MSKYVVNCAARVAMLTLFCLLATHGFYTSWFHIASVSALLSFFLYEYCEKQKYIVCIISLSLFVFVSYFSEFLIYSSFFLASVAWLLRKEREAVALLVSTVLPNVAAFHPLPNYLMHPFCTLSIFCVTYWVVGICNAPLVKKLLGTIAISVASIASLQTWNISSVDGYVAAPQYRITKAIESATGNYKRSSILSFNHQIFGKTDGSSAIFLDHDTDSSMAKGNYQQSRPWSSNLPIAPDFLALSINLDGYYAANLGANIVYPAGLLVGLYDRGTVQPLVIQTKKGQLIFADSDLAVNGMVPYQINLLKSLSGNSLKVLIIFHALLIFSLVFLWLPQSFVHTSALVVITALAAVLNSFPVEGDIRYVGANHKWPHTSLGDGVVREYQAIGLNYFFGNTNCKVLVVGTGHSATIKTESFVILEPKSAVKIGSHLVESLDRPLASEHGVVDARNIVLDGISSGPCVIVEGVKVIATGTPAKNVCHEYSN